MWKVIADSARGTSHERSGQPCQDCCSILSATLASDSALILACADGAGSAEWSHLGSQVVCAAACNFFLARDEAPLSIAAMSRDDAIRLLESVRSALIEQADVYGVDVRALATTLLVAAIGENASAFLQIGDGAIVRATEELSRYDHVFWPQSGEYANTTNFVTSPAAMEVFEFVVESRRIDEIALFTDGLQSLALEFTAKIAHGPFFHPMFLTLRRQSDVGLLGRSLRAFLISEQVNARTDDDKTLILATRRVANGL